MLSLGKNDCSKDLKDAVFSRADIVPIPVMTLKRLPRLQTLKKLGQQKRNSFECLSSQDEGSAGGKKREIHNYLLVCHVEIFLWTINRGEGAAKSIMQACNIMSSGYNT